MIGIEVQFYQIRTWPQPYLSMHIQPGLIPARFENWNLVTQCQYYSITGCDGMGMCCEKKTMAG